MCMTSGPLNSTGARIGLGLATGGASEIWRATQQVTQNAVRPRALPTTPTPPAPAPVPETTVPLATPANLSRREKNVTKEQSYSGLTIGGLSR